VAGEDLDVVRGEAERGEPAPRLLRRQAGASS
jgi:hypothetical protein